MNTKKTLTASILGIVFNLISAVVSWYLFIILSLTISIVESQDGVVDFSLKFTEIMLCILIIISIINVILSITSIINLRKMKENFSKVKALIVAFIVSVAITLIINIAIVIMQLATFGWSLIVFTIVNIIILSLLISELSKNSKNSINAMNIDIENKNI